MVTGATAGGAAAGLTIGAPPVTSWPAQTDQWRRDTDKGLPGYLLRPPSNWPPHFCRISQLLVDTR